jgi:Ca-activated chloride channel family protein
MHRSSFALALLLALALPVAARDEKAPAETRSFTASCLLVPGARAFQAGAPAAAVQLKSVAVDATVEERVATVRLEITAEGAATADATAQLLVPLPRRAKLLEASLAETKLTASVRRGKAASALWMAAARHAASLEPLEFAGYDAVRTAGFAVPRGKTERLVLVYECQLPDVANRVDLTLPRTAGPREVEWTVSARIRESRPIAAVFSPTHELSTTHKGEGHAEVTVANARLTPGPVSISVLLGGPEPAATFFTFPDPASEGGYFLMLGAMPKAAVRTVRPREVLFVLDRSGSMGGEKIEQARRAILKSLRRMRDGEAFNVVDYASETRSFAPQPVVKNAQTVALAEQYVRGINAGGGTNIDDALVTALRLVPTPGLRPMVLFVTDGMPTEGEVQEFAIRANARAANTHGRAIHTVGIGEGVNAPLLSGLAESSGGSCRFVGPGEDVEASLVEVFDEIGDPALANARLEAAPGGLLEDLQPARLGNLRDGESFVVLGRYLGAGPVPVRHVGDGAETATVYDFVIDPAADGRDEPAVARMWAYRKVATIVRTIAETPPDGGPPPDVSAAAAEIARLAVEHGVVTDYTQFLSDPKVDLSNADRLAQIVYNALVRATPQRRYGAGAISYVQRQRQAQTSVRAPAREASAPAVSYIRDTTLVRRDDRWVDLRVLERGEAKPESIVKLGSADLDALRDALVKQRLSSVFAFPGALFEVDGRVVQIGEK